MAEKERITFSDVVVALVFVLALFFAVYQLLQNGAKLASYNVLLSSLLILIVAIVLLVKAIKISKKNSLSNLLDITPKTFYYLDEPLINDLYYQTHLDPELKQIETEESNSAEKGLSAKLKLLEPQYGKTSSSKIKKIFEPHTSVSMKYNRLEDVLRNNRDLQEGVESFFRFDQPIVEFQKMCNTLKRDFNFVIPNDLQDKLIFQYFNPQAVEALRQLSEKSGYALLKGDFKVSNLDEKFCCLTISHPLNDFLEKKEPPVSILINCEVSSLTSSGKMALKLGETIKITSLGKVIRWREEIRSLVFCPISIY